MSKEQQRELKKSVQPFTTSDTKKSIWQIINTIPPFFLLWFLAYQSLEVSVWLAVPFIVLAAGFVVRMFIIFHDCTHGSFFKNQKANRIMGTITGIFTHFAFEKWKRSHAIHHATSGNLDKRGIGDIWIMTVEEWKQASKMERLQYRLYRHPLVMFGLGPWMLFLYDNRLNRKGAKGRERWNTHLINASLVVLYTTGILTLGWAFLAIQLSTLFVSGVLGIWLFYVQHQFEDAYFEHEENWDFVKAAVDGSSYYKLPKVLQWLSGNIGYHHVHHLSPKVPNYNLEETHEKTTPLQKVTTVTLWSSFESIRFRLFDEDAKQFVTFKEAEKKQTPVRPDNRKRMTG
ncbi:fatty acid desaturase [Alkalicoccus urumqiensis]|uniref:Fatty acid desaturase n=1 Tax=Alkalicoccus urumqiensis TaxID=1548213 RepID=A0A2P6MJ55_ALKUR|nr:fatty acid desaturase [Alkalicoccus urumqiensis]PRO66319.1 fatty acid desaturase [Alkalicoccus urumqiensis]